MQQTRRRVRAKRTLIALSVAAALATLAPTSGRGGGARLSGGGWIGDGYTAGPGFTARIDSAIDQARRLNQLPAHARYDLLVSDLYGADTTQPSGTTYPCASGNCSNWISFIDDVVADVQAAGVNVNYDIWNEPDNGSFWAPGYAGTQYFQMWDSAVNEIRRLVPSGSIVGPSVSNFNNTYITEFLSHVKTAGTVPTYLNWHFSGTPGADAATVNGDLSADGISGAKLAMNEYLNTFAENAGYEAWYLAQLATSGIRYADHAIWADCCNVGSLDQTLVRSSSGTYVPTGQWWVYKDYADVTGSLASVSDSSSTDAVAAEDSSRHIATVLLGDDAGNTGALTLNLNGLTSIPWAFSAAGANVVVARIPDQRPLAQPIVVSSQILPPGAASLSLPINWVAANDAYFVTITPATTGSVTVDGAVTTASPNYFQYGSNWGQTTAVTGMYDGTANWSFTPGSTAVLHFTGNQVALHAVKDVDQGMMDVSVDGSAPVTIDDYSPTRNASGIVWTSPVLAPGPHVATITVDSTRNPASSGNNIAIDSADALSAASGGEGPYGGTAAAVPGTVQAANYDTGGQGVAYNVTSVNGSANSYRSDGVDLEACSDTGCGYDLGWTATGQWFRYTVNVATAGTYAVSFRVASPGGVTDGLHIANSAGTSLSGAVNVPATGGWQTYQTVTATVTLPAGQQTLTVDQDNGGWNLRTMAFAAGGGAGSALTASPSSLSFGSQAVGSTSSGPASALTASPASLAFGNVNVGSTSSAQTVTVSNPNAAAVPVSQLAVSGPFGHTSTCGASIPANGSCTVSVTFAPTATGSASGSLTVASSAPGSPLTVALSGTGISSTTNLALGKPATASSSTQTYVPANAVDGNTSTYWEATNGAWPATFTVNLGSVQTLGSITIDLPPSSSWSTRTQTLSVLGSTNGTTFNTLVGSATYTWNPSTGNTVTIQLPSGTSDQYVQLSFTANNVQNGAQASEILIYG